MADIVSIDAIALVEKNVVMQQDERGWTYALRLVVAPQTIDPEAGYQCINGDALRMLETAGFQSRFTGVLDYPAVVPEPPEEAPPDFEEVLKAAEAWFRERFAEVSVWLEPGAVRTAMLAKMGPAPE